MAPLPLPVRAPDPAITATARALVAEADKHPPVGLTLQTASPSIADLIDVIGEDATRVLCERLGGISREIGLKPSPEFVDAIGEEKAIALRSFWGGGRIYIPRQAFSPKARHEQIRSLAKAGRTRQEIALAMKISERQVYKVLAIARATPLPISA